METSEKMQKNKENQRQIGRIKGHEWVKIIEG